ncbi:MAG: hypothetical protein OK457_05080 [Thaumarchaeota archaeon]|nr:hypothetical protein [Nitrososphaerota archaeon]
MSNTQEGHGRRPRSRIESFVDLIFGLSLSVGAIALISSSPPSSPAELDGHILAFLFVFAFLITSWMIYTYQMSVLPVETRLVTSLNVIMLALVAIIPYLLNNVEFVNQALGPGASSALQNYASSLFAIDLAGILAILATFSHVISIEEKNLVVPELARIFRQSRNVQLGLAVLMVISLAPVFWNTTVFGIPARIYIWLVPVVVYWVRRFRQK